MSAASAWPTRERWSLLLAIVLWFVDRLGWLLRALGVDRERFRLLLSTRLVLDLRGSALGGTSGGVGGGLTLTIALAWLAGLGPALLAFFGLPPLLWMAAVQAVIGVMLVFLLLAQFGPMLVDERDVAIVGPLPVPERTLFAARLAHVGVYVGLLAATSSVWALLLGGFAYRSWTVPLSVPFCTLSTTVNATAFVALLYALLLRIGGPDAFQRLATWLQVIVVALFFGALQLGQHVVPLIELKEHLSGDSALAVWLPPMHSGALCALFAGDVSPRTLGLALLALALPLAGTMLVLWMASRHFVAALAGAHSGGGPRERRWPAGPLARFGERGARTRAEVAGYGLALPMIRRDRWVLRATWSSAAALSMMTVAIPMGFARIPNADLARFAPLALYLETMIAVSLWEALRVSESPAARWQYVALPLERPGLVLAGALRAVSAAVLVPALLVSALAIGAFVPAASAVDLCLAVLGTLSISLWSARRWRLRMPFTSEPRPGGDADLANLPSVFGTLAIAGLAAGVQALAIAFAPPVRIVLALALLPLLVLQWRELARVEPIERVRL